MALQIVDDLVDLTVHPAFTGKPFALDIRNRRMRLPLILGLQRSRGNELEFMQNFLSAPSPTEEDLRKILFFMERDGALLESERIARSYLRKADETLRHLESGFMRDCLRYLGENLISSHMQVRAWSTLASGKKFY